MTVMDARKTCSGCKEAKPLVEFGRARNRPDGHQIYCRPCMNEKARAYRDKFPDRVKITQTKSKVKRKDKIDAYNAEYYARDPDRHCKRAQKWREENPELVKDQWKKVPKEKRAKQNRNWRKKNLESQKARRRKNYWDNRDGELIAMKDWKRRNPEKNAFYGMKRIAAKLRAIPSWADINKIEAIYAEARRLTELTGISHHVDHIVPLQSPWVCGLHCEANLQILPCYENQSKSNRHWPDMPDLSDAEPMAMAA